MKKAIITGAGGFLGRYVTEAFLQAHYHVVALGRKNNTTSGKSPQIYCDLSEDVPIFPAETFDKVVHIAGKAHVFPKSKAEAEDFFKVNTEGTRNLLSGLDKQNIRPGVFVFVSTVAVYGLVEGENIKENHPTNANTPYGESKLKAEELVQNWCTKNSVNCLILRLPLIAGENPPGNLGDMKNAIKNGMYFSIKNNTAKKSVVIASDIARLIAKTESISGIYHLTDGIHPDFQEIESAIEKRLNKRIIVVIPRFIINIMAKVGDTLSYITKKDMPISSLRLKKLISSLTFNDEKARKELGWNPDSSTDYISKYI